jgi:hypothetical protein
VESELGRSVEEHLPTVVDRRGTTSWRAEDGKKCIWELFGTVLTVQNGRSGRTRPRNGVSLESSQSLVSSASR